MGRNGALDLIIKIGGKVDPSLNNAIATATKQTSGIVTGISSVAKAAAVGAAAVGSAALAGVVKSTQEAIKWETTMADPAKYVGGVTDAAGDIDTEQYNRLSDAMLTLSTQIPYTKEELAELAAAAGQSGKDIHELIETANDGSISGFLKDVAVAGSALDITASQAGDWAAKWEVALDKNHKEIMDLFAQINYLGNNTATTAAEIGNVVNEAASLGQIAGIDPAATAAIADAMLSMGVNGSKAATSINRMYSQLSLGAGATKAMKSAYEELGFTAEGVARGLQENGVETVRSILGAINEAPKDQQVYYLKTLFGQWAIQGAAKLTGNLEFFDKALGMVEGQDWQGSLEKEFKVKDNTTEATFQKLSSAVERFEVELGNNFKPILKEVASLGIDVMNGITDSLPDLSRIAEAAIPLLRSGVEGLGTAIKGAMPYVESIVNFVLDNGPQAAGIAGAIAAAWSGLIYLPEITGTLGKLKNLSIGNVKVGGALDFSGLFKGGKAQMSSGLGAILAGASYGGQVFQLPTAGVTRMAASAAQTAAPTTFFGRAKAAFANSKVGQAVQSASQVMADSKVGRTVRGNVIGGAFAAQNLGGLTSNRKRTYKNANLNFVDAVLDADASGTSMFSILGSTASRLFENTAAGKAAKSIKNYAGGVRNAFAGVKNTTVAQTVASGAKLVGGAGKEVLQGIAGPNGMGLTDIAQNVVQLAGDARTWAGGKLTAAKSAVANASLGSIGNTVSRAARRVELSNVGRTARRVMGHLKYSEPVQAISGLGTRIANSGIGQAVSGAGAALANSRAAQAVSGIGSLVANSRFGRAASAAGSAAASTTLGQAASGVKNLAVGAAGRAASAGGKALALGGKAAGAAGQFAGAGLNLLSTVWKPAASGVGMLLTKLLPITGVITAIIAAVSLLGDHLDDIRGIVQNVFGDAGVQALDSFVGVVQGVGQKISYAFSDENLGNIQSNIRTSFGDGAADAFGGVITIIQSVKSVLSDITKFAETTVKPGFEAAFGFIKDSVIPGVLAAFTATAPYIGTAIQNIGSVVMTVMNIIAQTAQAVWPAIQFIATGLLAAAQVAPAVLAGFNTMLSGIVPIIESVKGVFDGVIQFVTGVFTGSWQQAWEGVKNIFKSAFDALEGLIKTPMNAVIAVVNSVIGKINSISVTAPDWVPVIGGQTIGFSIPTIPMLAKGGFTNGPSIAGEAGTEAVISFQPGARGQNIANWITAGRMLGVNVSQAFKSVAAVGRSGYAWRQNRFPQPAVAGGGGNGGNPQFVFAPNITINGNASKSDVKEALDEEYEKFKQFVRKYMRDKDRTDY